MKRLLSICLVLCVALFVVVSCGDDDTPTQPVSDTIAPSAITDLVITDSLGTSLQVQWTATGDDTTFGQATAYDVRIGTEPLTDANWDDAYVVAQTPTPTASGTVQSFTIEKVAWWTRYYVGIRVADEMSNWSPISNIAAGTPYTTTNYRLLIDTNEGMIEVDMDGNMSTFLPSSKWVEVLDDHVYTGASSITEYDFDGNQTKFIPLPAGISHYGIGALPGNRFAVISNQLDTVYIIDDAQHVLARVGMSEEPGGSLQSTYSQVVDNQLYISEDGHNHVVVIDLDTYALSIFKDLSDKPGWLGAIDYADGHFCVCQSQKIWHFDADSDPELIATVPDGNITGAVMIGGNTFVTINFTGELLRVNNYTGDITVVAEGMNRPGDMEMIVRE